MPASEKVVRPTIKDITTADILEYVDERIWDNFYSPLNIRLPNLVTCIEEFMGPDHVIHSDVFVSRKNYCIMSSCFKDWFSSTMFASIPDIQVGYGIRFDVISSLRSTRLFAPAKKL